MAALTIVPAVPAVSEASPAPPSRRYIVTLAADGTDPGAAAAAHARRHGARVARVYRKALRGYAATLTDRAARAVAAERGVVAVERDTWRTVSAVERLAPWGLDRIDQRTLPLDGAFHHQAPDGGGVDVYIIDTGIRADHRDLAGRVRAGFDAMGGRSSDCNGHGTHVAGTAAGTSFGVAKQARLVAVRVFGCQGAGNASDVIAGIDWVTRDHRPGTPAVANMSLGGGPSPALDAAVRRAVADGVTFVVAAGNGVAGVGVDACAGSPARVPEVITVGAVDRSDTKAPFSDYGRCVDLFAPGVDISSDWPSSTTSTRTLTGTSMASPHVAGAAAFWLATHRSASPADVARALVGAAAPVVRASRSPAPLLLQLP